MPVAGQVIDFYDDTDRSWLKDLDGIGKYGSMELLSPEDQSSLPDDQFGLIVLTKHANVVRKFPLNDAGHIYLAAQYFDHNHTKLSSEEKSTAATHIREACDAYEIPSPSSIAKFAADGSFNNVVTEGAHSLPVDTTKESARQELQKTASAEINARLEVPESQYALAFEHDGESIRKYAMPDENHVKIASQYFKKYAMDLSPEHRHMFAQNVMRRAGELSVEVGDASHLVKWASPNYSGNLNWHLEQRKSLLPRNEEACAVLDKLASMRDSTEPVTFAKALHEFDQQTGLSTYYDRGVKDPWDASMGLEKQSNWSEDIDGDTVTEQDLKRVADSGKIRSHFGEAFEGQFKKHSAEVFSSLPTPEKVVIKQLAKGEI